MTEVTTYIQQGKDNTLHLPVFQKVTLQLSKLGHAPIEDPQLCSDISNMFGDHGHNTTQRQLNQITQYVNK